jgi:hypothetical protein
VGFAHVMDKFTDSPRISCGVDNIDVRENYRMTAEALEIKGFRDSRCLRVWQITGVDATRQLSN